MSSYAGDMNAPRPLADRRFVVAGLGVAGYAMADGLLQVGANVTVLEDSSSDAHEAKAAELESRGARVQLGAGSTASLPPDVEIVAPSPGIPPSAPLLRAAAERGVPVWSEIELAWQLRDPSVPWLAVTGTNGKTTTLQMLVCMLGAAGMRAAAVGNVGNSVVSAALERDAYDVIAVEASSFQLHYTESMAAHAAAILNIAPDHLDWHGSVEEYVADKARIFRGASARILPGGPMIIKGSPPDEWQSLHDHGELVTFMLGEPDVGSFGVVDGHLVDNSEGARVRLASVTDVQPQAPHNVANALAAAALARSVGVSPEAVRGGLRAFHPDAHRIAFVTTVDGVAYVNDSKATNTHAAAASLNAYASVVWVAGGQGKGADFDELVEAVRERLRGVVLLGGDRQLIAQALSRHAPNVPVIEVSDTDNKAMDHVIRAAAQLAQPGDTVLLAPACASKDMFANYAARGDAFAAAARRHEHG